MQHTDAQCLIKNSLSVSDGGDLQVSSAKQGRYVKNLH